MIYSNRTSVKIFLIFVILCAAGHSAHSQDILAAWDFNGNAGNEATVTAGTFDPAVSTVAPSGVISRGAGLASNTNADRYNADEWLTNNNDNATLAYAIANDKYMEWSIAASDDYLLNIESIVFNWQRSSTGPSSLTIRSSQDGYNSDLDTKTSLGETNTGLTVTLTGFENLQGTVTFRVYGYSGTKKQGSGGFEGSGNDLIIYGSTSSTDASDIAVNQSFTYPTSISYIDYVASSSSMNLSNSIAVFGLTLRDGGATAVTDGKTTALTSISFSTNGSTAVRAAAIEAGSGLIGAMDVDGATTFTLDLSGSPVTASDGSTMNFQLYVSFTEGSLITDNEQVIYTISAATADPTGTLFLASDAGGAESSNVTDVNTTVVTADQLQILQQPVDLIYLNEDFLIEAEATDALGTKDLDKNLNVIVSTGIGNLSSVIGLSQNTSSGTASWSDLRYDTRGANVQLAVSDADAIVDQVLTNVVTATMQIGSFTFTGASGNETTFAADIQPENATLSDISRGSGISAFSLADAFSANSWSIAPSGFDANSHYEISLTANTGYSIEIDAIKFDHRRSSSGPVNWEIRNSTDNYASSQGGSITGSGIWNLDQTISYLIADESGITFRIYAYDASSGAGTWALDNIELYGEIKNEQPPAFTSGYPQADSARIDGFHLRAGTNKAVTAYYLVKAYGNPAPTDPNDVINGVGGAQNGSFSVDMFSSTIVSGLSEATAYNIYWVLDDGVATPEINATQFFVRTSDNEATAAAPASQIPAASILATANSIGEAVNVISFDILDNGNPVGDLSSTNVSKIWIKNPNGGTDWTALLGGVSLTGSTLGAISLQDVRISADSMVIDLDPVDLIVPDQGSETITLAVYTTSSSIVDGTTLQFEISQSDPSQVFTSSEYGTQFNDPFVSSQIMSSSHTIDVDADRLQFTTIPTIVAHKNEVFSVTVQAKDANGNLDTDENASITLSRGIGTGTLSSSSSLTKTMSGGIAAWDDLEFDGPQGSGETFTLIATDDASILSQAVSPTITFSKSGELVVSSGNTVTVSGSESYSDVTVEDNSTLDLAQGASITITGNLSINGANGDINDQGGTIYFDGTNAQVIQSDQPAKTVDFHNIEILDTQIGGVTNEININLLNTLKLNAGASFDANGSGANDYDFTLVSSPTSTARIAAMGDGATLNGNVVWQRSLRDGPAGWRYVGTSIKGQNVGDWSDDVRIQGIAESLPTYDPNFALYSEPLGTDAEQGLDGWVNYTQNADAVAVGVGNKLYEWSSQYDPTLTIVNKGLPFIGNGSDETASASEVFSFPISFTSTAFDGGGWNLLANPYPCELDWDAAEFVHTNIQGNAVYIWNPTLQQYGVYNGSESINGISQYIASGQAFFVKAIDGSAVLSVTENAKSTDDGNSFQREAALQHPQLRIKIKSDNNHIDETLISFRADALDSYEPTKDAVKFAGGWINISSLVDDEHLLAINTMGSPAGIKRVKLNLEPYYFGNYRLQFPEILNFKNESEIQLLDKYLDRTVHVDSSTIYSFTIDNNDAASYGAERFEILLISPVTLRMEESAVRAGQEIVVPVYADQLIGISAMDIGLQWAPEALGFVAVENINVGDAGNFDLAQVLSGELSLSWDSDEQLSLPDSTRLFEMRFNALNGVPLADLTFNEEFIRFESDDEIEMPISTSDAAIRIFQNRLISGKVLTADNVPVSGIHVLASGNEELEGITGDDGSYSISTFEQDSFIVSAERDADEKMNEGVSTLDIILARRHILDIDQLSNPYQAIAADVNMSKSISAIDLTRMRSTVLGMQERSDTTKSWLIIPKTIDLSANPYAYELDTDISIDEQDQTLDFVAVKLGDVNNSWISQGTERASLGELEIELGEAQTDSQIIEIPVNLIDFNMISGFQFSIQWDPDHLHFEGIQDQDLEVYVNEMHAEDGVLAVMWDEPNGKSISTDESSTVFMLRFKAQTDTDISTVQLNSELIKALAVDSELNAFPLKGRSVNIDLTELTSVGLQLFQNSPNPLERFTDIGFKISQRGIAKLSIINILGEVVYYHEGVYSPGEYIHRWERNEKGHKVGSGIYIYQIESGGEKKVRKMLIR